MHLPVLVDRPAAPPVTPIADDAGRLRDERQQQPSTHVYRGELLDENFGERRYRPTLGVDVHPRNRRAIDAYHVVAYEPTRRGQILDGFI